MLHDKFTRLDRADSRPNLQFSLSENFYYFNSSDHGVLPPIKHCHQLVIHLVPLQIVVHQPHHLKILDPYTERPVQAIPWPADIQNGRRAVRFTGFYSLLLFLHHCGSIEQHAPELLCCRDTVHTLYIPYMYFQCSEQPTVNHISEYLETIFLC